MKRFIILAALAFPFLAHAHTGHGGHGIASGLSHPLFGTDHLLAMVCVGAVATLMGGKALWRVPATFVGVMLLGGLLGMSGLMLGSVETMIALSVVGLGATLAIGRKVPAALAYGGTTVFALFHGHAHGTEMPAMAQPALYAFGFAAMTILLHVAGLTLGTLAANSNSWKVAQRIGGLAVATAGVSFLVS
jgi:urease accessory protein